MVSSLQQSLTSTAIPPAQTGDAIATAVAVKSLNAQRQQGAAVLKLLDSAAETANSSPPAGDALVAKATGLGSQLDVTA